MSARHHPQCRVCQRDDRSQLELELAGGASIRAVAAKHAVPYHQLRAHWMRHVPTDRRAALVLGPVQRMELSARVSEESSSVIDHYRVVRSGLYTLFQNALSANDRNGGALIAGRLIHCLDSMGHLMGQLATSPLVQVNQQTNNYFINDPQFARFQADLIRVLSSFPDARAAVMREFEQIETAPVERPALEHRPDVAAA